MLRAIEDGRRSTGPQLQYGCIVVPIPQLIQYVHYALDGCLSRRFWFFDSTPQSGADFGKAKFTSTSGSYKFMCDMPNCSEKKSGNCRHAVLLKCAASLPARATGLDQDLHRLLCIACSLVPSASRTRQLSPSPPLASSPDCREYLLHRQQLVYLRVSFSSVLLQIDIRACVPH